MVVPIPACHEMGNIGQSLTKGPDVSRSSIDSRRNLSVNGVKSERSRRIGPKVEGGLNSPTLT